MLRSVLILIPLLIGSATSALCATPRELAGTNWRWIALASSTETLTVLEPDRYTLAFTNGDRVALRADCNRGAGSVAFPAAGVVQFGPLALTRALCPSGSLGERFAREVGRAARWSVRGDELALELESGEAVLRFKRHP
jgi:para-nitrobenzyl esterase